MFKDGESERFFQNYRHRLAEVSLMLPNEQLQNIIATAALDRREKILLGEPFSDDRALSESTNKVLRRLFEETTNCGDPEIVAFLLDRKIMDELWSRVRDLKSAGLDQSVTKAIEQTFFELDAALDPVRPP